MWVGDEYQVENRLGQVIAISNSPTYWLVVEKTKDLIKSIQSVDRLVFVDKDHFFEEFLSFHHHLYARSYAEIWRIEDLASLSFLQIVQIG